MSSISPDAVREELRLAGITGGQTIADIQDGTRPLSRLVITGVADTGTSFSSLTGASTLTDNDIMHQTLVAGAGVTTLTYSGFARVSIVDQAGNITNGDYYIPFGTLS